MRATRFITMVTGVLCLFVFTAPLLASEIDTRIEKAAKKSYVFKTYLKGDDVEVKSTNSGMVTLTGTVSEETHKSLAEETVLALPGVTNVDNQIEIKGEQPTQHSDAWISMKVKSALLFRKNVSGTSTDVSVSDGNVTLSGKASSQAQKDLATEYAKDIDGVESVQNNMTVSKKEASKTEKIKETVDDASVTAQVKTAILFHKSTSALNTKVETKNNVVTLTGTAKNDAEKELATKVAKDINGVKSVVNNMVVEY